MNSESGFQVDKQGPEYYEKAAALFMRPFVEALVGSVVQSGDVVLDIACGTGFATREASEAVGMAGRVVGSDLNANMLALAQSLPHKGNVSWHQAPADDMPYIDNEFDVVICQQGLQFFPDPVAGLKEIERVSKRGMAVTVFASLENSPFLAAAWDMMTHFCDTDPSEYSAAFRHSDEVLSWFNDAGLTSASVKLLEPIVALPPVADYLPMELLAVPWGGSFFQLNERVQAEAFQYVREKLSDYKTADGFAVPFRSHLIVAAS